MEQIILETRHINKYFHDPVTVQVLKDISFSIHKSEFVSIIGKSGCGKSTLLYILSTMDTDYDGDRKSTRLNSSHSSISYAVFFFNDTATTEIYTLSLHDALPICLFPSSENRVVENRPCSTFFLPWIPIMMGNCSLTGNQSGGKKKVNWPLSAMKKSGLCFNFTTYSMNFRSFGM